MLRERLARVTGNLVILFILSVCMISLLSGGRSWGVGLSRGQHGKKAITVENWQNPPIEFVKVKVLGREIPLRKEFDAAEDSWFKGLSVTIKNVSNRDIKYMDILLMFPETAGTGAIFTGELTFGDRTGESENGKMRLLKPGKEAELTLEDADFDGLKAVAVKDQLWKSMSTMTLNLQVAMFTDGTYWSGGETWQRDAGGSKKWVPVARD